MQSWIARCAVVVAFALFGTRSVDAGGTPGWIPLASSSAGFSSTQGQNGWSYCYATTTEMGAPVTPMAHYIPNGAACGCGNLAALWSYAQDVCFCGQQFCFISPTITHINTQGATQIPVRRYELPASGRYALTATFSHGGGCTGVERIRLEVRFRNAVLWSAESGPGEQTGTVEILGQAGEFVDLVSVPLGGQCGGAHVAKLDVSAGDCNGNGIADSADIANFDLLDLDADGVPDCCASGGDCASKGSILVVSQSGGGDFTSIQAAYDAALDGDTVLILPGTYTNPNGLVLNAWGKAVRVVSRDGPTSVLLDAEGRSGVMGVGAHHLQIIEGLTIANSVGTACGVGGSLIKNCIFRDNSGNWGGAVFSAIYAQPRFENCTFLRNTGTRGGAVYAHQDFAVMTFIGCTFEENSSPEGGALHIRDGAHLVLENCSFARNSSTGTGGAAFVWFAGQVVRDCVFEDNIASSAGAFFTGPGSFERTTFRGNSSAGAGAVAGHLQYFTDCLFESNSSTGAGGAMSAWCFGPTLVRCTFRHNTANGAGAIFAGGCEMQMTATDCVFEGNRAETTEQSPGAGYYAGMGGAIRMDGTHLVATRCTFIGNFATYGGGATNRWYGSIVLDECLYRDNVALASGGADFSLGGANPGTFVSNTDACDNFPDEFVGWWDDVAGNTTVDHCMTGVQGLVSWPVSDGGNGHVYGILAFDAGLCWDQAKALAERRGGSLASVASEPEAAFIFDRLASRPALWTRGLLDNRNAGPYLGAYFDRGSWRWTDGSLFAFERFVPGVPPAGSVAMLVNPAYPAPAPASESWGWTEACPANLRPNSAVLEFDADCNANGIVDVLETSSGAVTDVNRNNIPDACECVPDIFRNGTIDGGDLGILLSQWGLVGDLLESDLDGDGIVNGADLAILLGSWGPCN
jgi:predicted outer membrane repeat protein